MSYHDPVLLTECLEGLRIDPTGSYVDVTFGGGGHSKAILDQLTTGTLFAFDQDPDAKNNLPDHPNLVFIAANFRYIKNHLRLHGAKKVDGILADLGVSSHQFDEGSRGFSIRFDGPLDMRMNPAIGISVEEVLATYEEQALYDLFRKHTDLKSLKPLVHGLLLARVQSPLKTTAELRELEGQRETMVHELDSVRRGERTREVVGRVFADSLSLVRTHDAREAKRDAYSNAPDVERTLSTPETDDMAKLAEGGRVSLEVHENEIEPGVDVDGARPPSPGGSGDPVVYDDED